LRRESSKDKNKTLIDKNEDCPVSQTVYAGYTTNLKQRLKTHNLGGSFR